MGAGGSYGVLGPLLVHRDGVEVDLGPPTQRALLAALLVDAGRTVTTAELVRRVWGVDDVDAHRTALQVALSRLRKRLAVALGDHPVRTVPGGYRVELARADIDSAVFADLVTAARAALTAEATVEARDLLTRALSLWRGRPFEGVDATLDGVVAGLVEQRASALELAAELDLALGRHVQLCAWLPREVAAHPLREGLRGDLMVALYRAGRQAEALELFDATRRLLGDELGIDPGPDLQRVHALVLRHDPALDLSVVSPDPAPTPPATAPAAPAPGLVGRDAELARARSAVTTTTTGPAARLLLVTGEAGIGKSRLVEEVVGTAGGLAVWGRVLDQDGLPAYWPWVHVLDELDRALPDVVAPLLHGAAAPARSLLGGDEAPPSRGGLFRAVAALLEAAARARPLVVVLEDLHWADPETVDLTEYLLSALDRAPVTFVWTVRTPLADSSPTDRLLLDAARHPRAVVIALAGLDRAAVQALTAAHLGSPVGRGSADRLRERTGGNPFFVVELTRLLAQERSVHGRATGPVPDGVRAVVEQRLRHLGPDTVATLTAAAVHGRALDATLLAEVRGTTPTALVDALDDATRAGLLVPAGPAGKLAFTHALVQETLVQACGPMRRRALHAEVAAALLRRHGADGGAAAGVSAGHLVAAGRLGDPRRAAELSIAAAPAARRRCAVGEATRLLRQTLGLLDLQPGVLDPAEELDVRVQLGALMTTTMAYDRDEVAAHADLVAELSPGRQPLDAAVAGLWAAWGLAMAGGPAEAAEELSARLRHQAEQDGDALLALAVHDVLGTARHFAGRMPEARAELLAAIAGADALPDRVDLGVFVHDPAATTRTLMSLVALWTDDLVESARWAAEARSRATEVDDPYTSVFVGVAEANRLALLGDAAAAGPLARRSGEGGRHLGLDGMVASAAVVAAWSDVRLAVDAGNPDAADDAVGELADGLAAYRRVATGYESLQQLLQADAFAHRGRHAAAAESAREGIAVARAHGEAFTLPSLLLALGQSATAQAGRPVPATRDAAEEAGVLARAGGQAWVLRAVPGVLAGTGAWRPAPR